ncbi:MAG: hypothetical protein U0871_02410 [Gemmataceae bacterium]
MRCLLTLFVLAPTAPPNLEPVLAPILAVGREGDGNEKAAAGWKQLTAVGSPALLPTLTAFDTASPTAANWLRSAVDAIAEQERAAGRKLDAAGLAAFVKDTKRSTAARRIAFELVAAQDKPAADALLGNLRDDPSPDLRRDAIAAELRRIENAQAISTDHRLVQLRGLFDKARDKDQVEELAKRLEAGKVAVDLTRHFGFVTEWLVAGPFDGEGRSGYGKAFPPETGAEPAAKYVGKGGAELRWQYAQSSDKYGSIDLNAALGKHKNATAYAVAELTAPAETACEVRVSTPNAVEVFLNGKKLYAREEYHHGTPFDQYAAAGTLVKGKNELLIKLCQNDQKDSWAQEWQFAARVCDPTGGPLPLTQTIVKDGKPAEVKPGAVKPSEKKAEPKTEGK